ncbi:MAG: translation initiation factor IF-2 [Thermotogae bacterium]|nr:translation initiation factor IF-2 [Thermotogota bacterium]
MRRKGPIPLQELAEELKVDPKVIIQILRENGYRHVRSKTHNLNRDMEMLVRRKIEEQRRQISQDLQVKKQIYQPQRPSQAQGQRRPKRRDERRRIERQPRHTKKLTKSRTKPKPKRKEEPQKQVEKIIVSGPMSLREFADALGREPEEIIQKAFMMGVLLTINHILDPDMITALASEFGVEVEFSEAVEELVEEEEDLYSDWRTRPPIVTVMGHVDHGKTTLLDAIRGTSVASQEAGGITQSIGAWRVKKGDYEIIFIDTPGHEAFTAMRARGAQVTDIVILVVAANEGVKPQTVEAINHAKTAGVPIIVAINKIDVPGADPMRVKNDLMRYNLVPEEYGGDTIFVEVSALKKIGIDDLLDAIILKAEELDLKAPYKGPARAVVIESQMDTRGRGPLGSVIVQKGTLKVGDAFWCGPTYGKVRALYDQSGKRVQGATPSMPVVVQGFEEVPRAGDILVVVENVQDAKERAEEYRKTMKYQIEKRIDVKLMRRIQEKLQAGEKLKVPVVIKADTQGSVEALSQAVSKMKYKEIEPEVIHSGVGPVTPTDVDLATASEGVILAFNTRVQSDARKLAEARGVIIRTDKVIYRLLEELENILASNLEPEIEEVKIGEAEVRATFNTRAGTVAGCYVRSGKIVRDALVKVIRDGEVIAQSRIASLKRFKDDVREVTEGYECGVRLESFNKFKPGDLFEIYIRTERQRTLTKEE